MLNYNMKTILSVGSAVGAAIVCLVMVFLEMINQDIPALVWLTFSVFCLANVVFNHKQIMQI